MPDQTVGMAPAQHPFAIDPLVARPRIVVLCVNKSDLAGWLRQRIREGGWNTHVDVYDVSNHDDLAQTERGPAAIHQTGVFRAHGSAHLRACAYERFEDNSMEYRHVIVLCKTQADGTAWQMREYKSYPPMTTFHKVWNEDGASKLVGLEGAEIRETPAFAAHPSDELFAAVSRHGERPSPAETSPVPCKVSPDGQLIFTAHDMDMHILCDASAETSPAGEAGPWRIFGSYVKDGQLLHFFATSLVVDTRLAGEQLFCLTGLVEMTLEELEAETSGPGPQGPRFMGGDGDGD